MLPGVYIEHEIDQGPLEPGPQSPVDGKARASNFCRSFEIQDAQFRSQVPVRLRLEIKFSRLAGAADFDVLFRARANWYRFVGKVWNGGHQLPKGFVEFLDLLVELGDTHSDLPHLLLSFGGITAGFS